MAQRYNLLFVPHIKNRKKISSLRASICKQAYSIQALQYPVHMSLISGGFSTKDYSSFEKELKEICKKQDSIILKSKKTTDVLPNRFWTGISILRSGRVKRLQLKLQALRNRFADKKEKHYFRPLHITLAFPAKVDGLKKLKCPVKNLSFDRVTIVRKEELPYRIFKHVKFAS
ncbi:2'-5' RNA ligase family protein [archaeon]|nr:2'-5' RNA ligase family protein [archaeon]